MRVALNVKSVCKSDGITRFSKPLDCSIIAKACFLQVCEGCACCARVVQGCAEGCAGYILDTYIFR